jgi:integrase/recombinase XerD
MREQVFHGPLASDFCRFVEIMKGLGDYGNHFWLVGRLDRFLHERHPHTNTLTKEILSEWLATFSHLSPITQRRYRSDIFLLCKFLRSRDSSTAMRAQFPIIRPTTTKPHVFTRAEVVKLLETARSIRTMPKDPLRPLTFELVVAILYACGLRIGEVISLNVGDYDSMEGVLKIRKGKFGKSRLVPVSRSLREQIAYYLNRRRELEIPTRPADALVWSPYNGRPSKGFMKIALMRLMRRAGIKPPRGRCGPRVHDLRHTFAVHRLLDWYKQGADVQTLLPRLSTYMGHINIQSTQVYLRYMPEVLAEANRRFEVAFSSEGQK